MLLGEWALLVVAIGIAMTMPAALLAFAELRARQSNDWTSGFFSFVILSALLLSLCFRSPEFGVDTPAYLEVFRDYCNGRAPVDEELSFWVSAILLNTVMLGTCSPSLLPAAWGALLVGVSLAVSGQIKVRLLFAALLLFSMIGIELATNALRQGLSVVFLVAALSFWPTRKSLSAVLGAIALALHGSAPLAVAALLLSSVSWRFFLIVLAVLITAVGWAVQDSSRWWIAEPFLYEVYKYLGHESDEFWIRALVGTSLLAMLLTPLVSAGASRVHRHADYSQAAKLAFTAAPFLSLPYFGYRYIYAIAPVVLFSHHKGAVRQRSKSVVILLG